VRETIKANSKLLTPSKIYIPEKHYTVALFLATTVVGMLILIYGVYSASRDFEMHYKINTLYSLLESGMLDSLLTNKQPINEPINKSYYISVLPEGISEKSFDPEFPLSQEVLESSRMNEQGGFVATDNGPVIWVIQQYQNKTIVLAHYDNYLDIKSLFRVYARYLTVPAVFYVWLMIWATLIIHFLTKKLHAQKNQMEHMALYDGLTDLPNRHLFNDRLEKLIKGHHRQPVNFSLAIIDLNNFKIINDTFGHFYGDELLSTIAARLKDSVRQSDTVARLGGDEFALLISQAGNEDMLEMCERIHEKIVQPVMLNGTEVCVGASIGIASFPEHGIEAETLLHKADQSMYKIKSCGGGALLYQAVDAYRINRQLHSV